MCKAPGYGFARCPQARNLRRLSNPPRSVVVAFNHDGADIVRLGGECIRPSQFLHNALRSIMTWGAANSAARMGT